MPSLRPLLKLIFDMLARFMTFIAFATIMCLTSKNRTGRRFDDDVYMAVLTKRRMTNIA